MRYIKRVSVIIILITSISVQCQTAWTENTKQIDTLGKKQEELDKVYKDLQKRKKELQETKREQAAVLQRLFLINRDLRKTKGQLGRASKQIQQNETKLNYLQVSLTGTKQKMDSKTSLFKERLREIYKSKGTNYLEMLISPDTLADFINRIYFFEKLLSHDSAIINDIVNEHKKIKKDKNELDVVTSDIKVLARFISDKKNKIEKQAQAKKEISKKLEERREKYEREVAILEKTSQEIENFIQKLVAERAKKGIVAQGSGSFIWPARGRRTSNFGYRRSPFTGRSHMHNGLDIANSYGSPIEAADSGEVLFSGWQKGYGKTVIIDHGRRISTVYAHMSRIYVQEGESVRKGQVIGLIGTTGYSTGPHLHFEVRKNGVPQNPIKWLP